MKKILLLLTILTANLSSFAQVPTLSITQPSCTSSYGSAEVTSPLSNAGPIPQDLFISEITDANTGGLSYIEIYNGTGTTIDLSNYKLKIYSNGSATATCDLPLSGSIPTSNVFVIAVGSTTNQGGIVPDLTFITCGGFNTNDAVVLTSTNDTVIDLWGATDGTTFTPQGQPGYTYRRRADATVPSLSWDPADWDSLDPEDYSNVGLYSAAVTYSYSLDSGPWQVTTVFLQLPLGTHTIAAQNNNTSEITQTTFDIVPAITTLPVTNFIYQSPVCIRNFLLYPITTTNFTTGGTFLATQSLVINPSTGAIDLTLTPPGNYVITYVVSPDLVLCTAGGTSSFNLTILPTSETPQGNTTQIFTMPNPMVMNLIVAPTTVTWYNSYSNAINQFNPFDGSTPLINGATYFAVNNETGCPSSPFAVTVQLALSNAAFTDFSFAIVPNPANDILHIQTSNQTTIDKIIISDISGKTVINSTSTSNEVAVEQLEAGMYFIEVFSGNQKSRAKFMKR